MSTPEKPRPSLDDTLRRIDTLLADLKKTTAEVAAQLTEQLAPPDHEIVFTEPDPPLVTEGPMPDADISRLNVLVVEPGALPGHRRSCQYDGPPGPGMTCPGCAEIDADFAIAHAWAAPQKPERGWLAALRRLFT